MTGYQVANMRVHLQYAPRDSEVIDTVGELGRLVAVLRQTFPEWHVMDAGVENEALL